MTTNDTVRQQKNTDGRLLVFGDSHSVIWEGTNVLQRSLQPRFPNVTAHHLGPALAYNLMSDTGDELGKWGFQIIDTVKKLTYNEAHNVKAIMLSFGEIDIRTQIIKRSVRSRHSIDYAVQQVVSRLHRFATILFLEFGIKVLVWEPVATSGVKHFSFNPAFPAVGTEFERNYATKVFAVKSREHSIASRKKRVDVFSFGIADQLMSFYVTNPDYFEDGCHLNLRGLELGVASLKKLCLSEPSLPPLFHIFDDPNLISSEINSQPPLLEIFDGASLISPEIRMRDAALGAKLVLSSTYSTPNVLHKTNRGWCFHTNKEANPNVLIDIGYASLVKTITIFNRIDCYQERAYPLEISAGLDPANLQVIKTIDNQWGDDGSPVTFEIAQRFGPVRYLLLRLLADNYFHLGAVQIFEESYLICESIES